MARRHLLALTSILLLGACRGTGDGRGAFAAPLPDICGPAGTSALLLDAGILAGSTHLDCEVPEGDAAAVARFTEVSGQESAVTGGSAAMEWAWEGPQSLEGRMALLAVDGEDGYFVVPLGLVVNPLPAELFIRQDAEDGTHTIRIAIDDGTGQLVGPPVYDEESGEELGRPPVMHPGPWLEFDLAVIEVQGGDIQVSASWNTDTDVDLHVIDPSGEEIYWSHPESASGGALDLDSNAACTPGPRLENVYWAEGAAPAGTYEVRLAYWSDCDLLGETEWRVTVVLGGTSIDVYSGSFEVFDVDPTGSGELVTEITWGE